MNLILASQSPRRIEILKNIGLTFHVIPADIDENNINAKNPEELVQKLALIKCRHVSSKVSNAIIIAADTVVVLDDKVLGKPNDKLHAYNMLQNLSDKVHEVLTGVCIINQINNIEVTEIEKTRVYFKKLTKEEIIKYVETNEPMDKAGAYGIQGQAAVFVNRIEGCYYNVVGLPLHRVYEMLKSQGVNLLGG